MKLRHSLLLLLLSFLVVGTLGAASAEAGGRVALVIGNGGYKNVSSLSTAAGDAKALADRLSQSGYTVTLALDATARDLEGRIKSFAMAASGADAAVVIFVGHGLTVGRDSYLLPVDIQMPDDRTASLDALSLTSIFDAVTRAKGLKLVVLDASRPNVIAETLSGRANARLAIKQGLGRIEPPDEVLVVTATKHETTAPDLAGGPHGALTTAMLQAMGEPGLDVRLLFGKVHDLVKAASGGKQEPYIYGMLGGSSIALVETGAAPGTVSASAGAAAPVPQGDMSECSAEIERAVNDGDKERLTELAESHSADACGMAATAALAEVSGEAEDVSGATDEAGDVPVAAAPAAPPKLLYERWKSRKSKSVGSSGKSKAAKAPVKSKAAVSKSTPKAAKTTPKVTSKSTGKSKSAGKTSGGTKTSGKTKTKTKTASGEPVIKPTIIIGVKKKKKGGGGGGISIGGGIGVGIGF